MSTVIVSDLHIGSRYFLRDRFIAFLSGLPPGTALVLNGDTVHGLGRNLSEKDREVLDLLFDEAGQRPVIWTPGNHDMGFETQLPACIEFTPFYAIGKRLYVTHGTEYMPYQRMLRVFGRMIRPMYRRVRREHLSVRLARRLPFVYKMLRRGMMMKATRFARENGYEAVTCGHLHAVDDHVVRGVRYINTGTWTESPPHYLLVNEEGMSLEEVT